MRARAGRPCVRSWPLRSGLPASHPPARARPRRRSRARPAAWARPPSSPCFGDSRRRCLAAAGAARAARVCAAAGARADLQAIRQRCAPRLRRLRRLLLGGRGLALRDFSASPRAAAAASRPSADPTRASRPGWRPSRSRSRPRPEAGRAMTRIPARDRTATSMPCSDATQRGRGQDRIAQRRRRVRCIRRMAQRFAQPGIVPGPADEGSGSKAGRRRSRVHPRPPAGPAERDGATLSERPCGVAHRAPPGCSGSR